jgi:type IV pilus assembly protein PilB
VENLIDLGYMDSKRFTRFLAQQPGIASILLENCGIEPSTIQLIPREFAEKHEVIPIDRLGPLLTVGMVCPLDSATLKLVEEFTGLRVSAVLCTKEQIQSAIRRHYREQVREPFDVADWSPER